MKKDNLIILVAFILCCIFLLVYFGTRHNKEPELDYCLEIQGTTLKNHCAHHSITFPFDNTKIWRSTYICQDEQGENGQGNTICLGDTLYNEENPFDPENLTQIIPVPVLSHKTGTYQENTAHCFSFIINEKLTPQHTCFLKLKDNPGYGLFIISYPQKSEIPLETLEKMMNSYKKL